MTNLRLEPVQVMRLLGCDLSVVDHYIECVTHPFDSVDWDERTRYAICSRVQTVEELLDLGWVAPPIAYKPSGHSLVAEQLMPEGRRLEICECGYVNPWTTPFIAHALEEGNQA